LTTGRSSFFPPVGPILIAQILPRVRLRHPPKKELRPLSPRGLTPICRTRPPGGAPHKLDLSPWTSTHLFPHPHPIIILTTMPDQPPNTLYYGDNLEILLRYIEDESIDLIYLDPPFNSNADYNVLFAEKDGTAAIA